MPLKSKAKETPEIDFPTMALCGNGKQRSIHLLSIVETEEGDTWHDPKVFPALATITADVSS